MATHSSILAWRIPQTEEPGRLQRVGHDLTTKQQHSFLYTFYFHKNKQTGRRVGGKKERKQRGRRGKETYEVMLSGRWKESSTTKLLFILTSLSSQSISSLTTKLFSGTFQCYPSSCQYQAISIFQSVVYCLPQGQKCYNQPHCM